ncbi:MAG: hypothetical protein ACI9R3_005527 [Verrucomicrobiales bacterium]|jgi:hypothetical protein
MTPEELLEIANATPDKDDGRNVWVRFRPAAFVLREKGYQWPEIAQKFIEAGEPVPNVESFCASMSRSYNDHLRKISQPRDQTTSEH